MTYQHPFDQPQYYSSPPTKKRQSGLGIASLIIGILLGIIEFAAVILAAVMVSRPGGMQDSDPEAIALGLTMCGGMGVLFIGLILGIVSLFFPDRSKLMGILGICINLLVLLGMGGLMLVGLAAGP